MVKAIFKTKLKMHAGKYDARVLFAFIVLFIFLSVFIIMKSQNVEKDEQRNKHGNKTDISSEKLSEPQSLQYYSIEKKINGLLQKIHIIKIDLSQKEILIFPKLSFGKIFGYQVLNEIADSSNAYAAVNAGFFYVNGYPSGMVAKDGRLITASSGKYPVLLIKDDLCELKNITTAVKVLVNHKYEVDVNLNPRENLQGYNLYTDDYGSKNRFRGENITAVVKNNVVERVYATDGDSGIPKEGYIISASLSKNMSISKFAFKPGDSIKLITVPEFGENVQAYECGTWLVKDGKNAAPDYDAWVGGLNTREPRTAVAIKDNRHIFFIVVDGRQPSYSYGVTAKELADIIIDLGCDNAAMLDGGASSEMIVKGEIVNKPSFKGQERPLGGGIIIKFKNK